MNVFLGLKAISQAMFETAQSPPKGALVLSSPTMKSPSLLSYAGSADDDKTKQDHNPFADHSSLPPPPFQLEGEDKAPKEKDETPVNAHSHHFATAYLTQGQARQHSVPVQRQANATVQIQGTEDEVRTAADNLARALEAAAEQQTDKSAKRHLLRKAKKIRKNANAIVEGRGKEKSGGMVAKNAAGGFLLLITVPIYLTGAMFEGTGWMLKATGMMFKGAGYGLKKVHSKTVEKMDLHI